MHTVIIAVARLTNDPDYTAYRWGRKKNLPNVHELLDVIGVDLSNGGGIPELTALQNFYLPHIENCSCMWYNRSHAVTLHIFSCNQKTHIYIYVCV